MSQAIIEKLNELSELQAALDVMRLNYEDAQRQIIAPLQPQIRELQAQIDALMASVGPDLQALNEEYAPLQDTTQQRIDALHQDVRNMVVTHGATVKGDHLQAVYVRGRTSWNTKALEGYAAAHPEIAAFKTVGEPSVSFRKV